MFYARMSKSDESESRLDFTKLWPRYSLVDVLKFSCQFKKREDQRLYVNVVTDVITQGTDEWLLESFEGSELNRKIKDVIAIALVPSPKDKEHYSLDENDFCGVADCAKKVILFITAFLKRLKSLKEDKNVFSLICDVCPPALVLTFEHIENQLWTTEASNDSAKGLLNCLCDLWNVEDNSKLLQCHMVQNNEIQTTESTILYHILKILTPNLLRNTWKRNPGSNSVFMWCLNHTSFPHLSEHLETVLPPALLFTDDYMLENKVCGATCLMHIIGNVSAEELRWYGRADVILEALRHQLYTKEPQLLAAVIPAILAILQVVEKRSETHEASRPITKYDEIYQQLLQDTEGENILAMRRIYTQHLNSFVEKMGISSVRYLGHTLKVIQDFLEIGDCPQEEARFNMLKLLQSIVRVCWPRIPPYMNDLLKMLMKCLCDLSMDITSTSEDVKTRLVANITKTLLLIKCLDPAEVTAQLKSLDCDGVPDICRQTCQQVVETDITTFTL